MLGNPLGAQRAGRFLGAFCFVPTLPALILGGSCRHDEHHCPQITGRRDGAQKLISKAEVLDRVGVTYVTIWKWMRTGAFPRARILGGKSCWVESEIDDWIEALPIRRLKGDTDGEAA
jgi:prophage regulatory protein